MRAAVLVEHGKPLQVQEVPDPVLDDDGVIIRVGATGVCRSDLHVARGDWAWLGTSFDLPLIPGHEVAGVVVAAGPQVRGFEVGDRVIVPFHLACGHCDQCRQGRGNLCRRLRFLGGGVDGSFAELMAVPVADVNCIALPDAVSDATGAALGCRYMTAYSAVRRIAGVRVGEWVAVYGAAGGIGLSAVQIAAAYGGRVIAIDRGRERLELAREAGAELVLDSADLGDPGDLVEAVVDLSGGGVAVSLDGVATAATTQASVRSLDVGGRHVQVGMTGPADSGAIEVPVDLIVAKELSFLGVTGNPHPAYDELLALVAAGRGRPEELVTERLGLGELPEALGRMEDFQVSGFVLVDPQQ
ncbi:alcohol dehydrogenase catalytic domain-containing protein [Nocardioides sp. LMS-CY]|uniref:alcohol dehydrogenase catalytic domain-containing protein n=1 Tax=Nocardioides sp. (strain LMS-CY) TaxID=2840457 RepID=UPI001C0019A6|nr:alcohol dehydrogenase catalytic domain-containing protein [Nocardioides sp. LMS-CY]QWF21755.1 alcohol dehydrogenase catalytic domain-containing protein [Nocardioides sp. LMS-CY]